MTKSPNPVDVHVGGRVRLRRMMLELSQEKLAERLGLTFQQVQKYEKGANRIGASRLFHIARLLNVPVNFFFDDLPEDIYLETEAGIADAESSDRADDSTPAVLTFLASAEGLQLNAAFAQIDCDETRRRLVDLVKTLAVRQGAAGAATNGLDATRRS